MNIIRLIILASELSRNLCKEVWLISTGKKEFIGLKTFDIWLGYLNSLMYNLHFEVLNSKDFGVPQNRERVFLIGVRNDLPNTFRFPPGFILTKRLKDILEPEVGEKYYLSDKMLSCLNTHSEKNKNNIGRTASFLSGKDLASTVKANYGKMPGDADYVKVDKVGFINQDTQGSAVYSTESVSPTVCAGTHGYAMGYIKESNEIMIACNLPGKHEATGRVYDTNGISPCVTAKQGGGHEPKILEPKAGQITGRNPENPKSRKSGLPTEQMLEINQNDDITNTITTVQKDNVIVVGQTTNSRIAGWHENENTIGAHMGDAKRSSVSEHVYHKPEGICNTIQTAHTPKLFGSRIRRLTPLECMRLQGFPDEYIKPCSDSQTYKQAGNSITVNVMEAIIKNLLPIIQ
ncbi:DNA cytosine methyltransferase [Sphingobacterium mizutaii]|uniref:DNA cytosine methyltransferase n=1 Tax=Sphingobacterium mizutaii TaxID=1010 RepID=UPI0035E3CBA0